ncbi:MAG: hypothetical protein U0U46_20030 [Saprospiraceae bacterium]|nr:hypothetical protein [Saprospiraceae bacterium]
MRTRTHLLFFLFLGIVQFGRAQSFGVVQETESMMSLGSRPGYRLTFVNAEAGMVEDMWTDFVKKNFGGKLKKDRKTKELTATGLKSPMVGIDPFTLYTTVEKNGSNVVLTAFFDKGASFLNRRDDPRGAQEVSNAMRQFYLDVRRAVIGKEMKAQEEKAKEMESRLKKLQRDNESLHKDIDNYKTKIKKAEEDIVKNQKDQEATAVDIETQRRLIEQTRQRLQNVENEQ